MIFVFIYEFDRIFEPGYQGKLTDAEYRTGAGMGLSITKEVIEKHSGKIQVESIHKGGDAHHNRFIVRLPRIQSITLGKEKK